MRLSVRDLAARRGERAVFAGLSFALGPGEALVVTGRNGAGKTTLLLCLAGLVRPAAGSVGVDGLGDAALPDRLHLVQGRDGLKPQLTAAENLRFAADLLGGPVLSPEDALARVGLRGGAALPVGALSAGQRRRVGLARLLVARRPLWLLDEPTTALDAAGQATLAHMMAEHRAGGGLVVAATHAPLGLDGAAELRLGPAGPVSP